VTQTGFIAAMAADLAFAAYDAPAAVDHRVSEWVIVSVWGSNREYLTLSRTGVTVRSDVAPPGLQPFGTHLGVLLNRVLTKVGEDRPREYQPPEYKPREYRPREDRAREYRAREDRVGEDRAVEGGTEEASEYLLMRNQPPDIPVGGVFFPTDGFVRLTLRGGAHTLAGSGVAGFSLTGHGRFAHCSGVRHGQHVLHDVPDPAPGARDALAWHMTAARRPWIGEFVPPERVLVRTAGRARPASPPPRHPLPVLAPPAPAGDAVSSPAHLAPADPAPHTRRRKRPETKHGVTTEA